MAQTLATGGASSLGSLGKGLIAVAKSFGDDFLRTFIKTYGDDAVRAIAAYGDDATKLALNNADDATKLLLSSGDDLSKTALSYGDDIGKSLASTGDKMIDDWYGLVDNTVDGAASSWDDVANSLDDAADDALAGKPNTGYNGITTEGAGNGLNKLPKTTEESVRTKLDTYLLEPNHPVGGSKAKWFKEALGFTRDNSIDLGKQIVFDPNKAIQTASNVHGTKFSQIISVHGANGKVIDVEFIFIKNNDGVIRLVTSIPTKR